MACGDLPDIGKLSAFPVPGCLACAVSIRQRRSALHLQALASDLEVLLPVHTLTLDIDVRGRRL